MVRRGAVLSGGASARMGRTKALIEVDGVPMAARAASALTAADAAPIVLVGGDPVELESLGFDVIPDRYPGQGPLGGVISALAHYQHDEELVAVVGCDLPLLDGQVLEHLFSALEADPTVDVAVARTDRRESAIAAWRSGTRSALIAHFERGGRALHAAIGELSTADVPVAADTVVNVNRPAELEALRADRLSTNRSVTDDRVSGR
ncbi:MAG: molybdenum cofactor guanylyltransferase [Actinomycetota bacterium]